MDAFWSRRHTQRRLTVSRWPSVLWPAVAASAPHASRVPWCVRAPLQLQLRSHSQPERILGFGFRASLPSSSSLQAAIAGGAAQSWAFFTLDTLLSTPSGVTSPTTVTFFAAKSMLNDVTPYQNQKRGLAVPLLLTLNKSFRS